MNRYRFSIKGRLQLWLLSALIILSTLFIVITYGVDRITLRDKFNHRLERIALAIPPNLKKADLRQINVKLPHGRDDFVLQIWDRDNTPIYQSNSDIALPRFSKAGFSVEPWQGERWGLYIRHTDENTIQVAQSLDARKEISGRYALHTVIPLLFFIPVMAFFIPLCVNRGLRSLTQLSKELESRNSTTLGALPSHDQPAELAPLTHALDTLFQRLSDALDIQKKFIADASHELRTPLTTLQIQTQLVEQSLGTGQQCTALADLKSSIKRTSHLVDQLLMTSRLESGNANDPRQLLHLDQLALDATITLLPFANSRKIDLGMGRMVSGLISGSEYQIKFLIRNLIDNAIRYTPSSGRVDVAIVCDADHMHLIVEDSGPGISVGDRERVFDRFYRCLGHETPGSGLGLAIVKQVVVQHGAEIRLDVSERLRGLKVIVSFERMARGT
jgi:two-component system OmpR family sensor kinase